MSQKERHPPGLYVLFFTEMWERFGFYTMGAVFTKYLRAAEPHGFGWSMEGATTLNSWYLMFVYFTPLAGGLIADRGLGFRNSVLIGGLVFILGYLLFSLPPSYLPSGIDPIWMVYAALACLVIGNGFFKPNVSAMVGQLYPEGSALKDRAYNIFYMGINVGALLAPVTAEYMVSTFDYRPAFIIAAAGMVVSVAILWTFKRYVDKAAPAAKVPAPPGGEPAGPVEDLAPGRETPRPASALEAVPEWKRVGALLVIFVVVIVFWMVFHQNSSTLTYWADENTSWKVSGIISNAINPFWVVTLSLPLVWFWGLLNKRGLEPSTPAKMTIGMFLTAASFLILYAAARVGESEPVTTESYASADFMLRQRSVDNLRAEGVPEDVLAKLTAKDDKNNPVILGQKFTATKDKQTGEEKSGLQAFTEALGKILGEKDASEYRDAILRQAFLFKVSPLWLIFAYMVVTLGELMLSPMGLSMVSKVAPTRLRGLLMGGWFAATAIGNKLTAIGVYYGTWEQSTFFLVLAGMALGMAFVLLLLMRPLKKAMPGV